MKHGDLAMVRRKDWLMLFGALGGFSAFVGVMAFLSTFQASDLDCETVKDHDARQECRAETKRMRSYCEFIKDHDRRHSCRAKVR